MRRPGSVPAIVVAALLAAHSAPALAQDAHWSRTINGGENDAACLGDGQTITRALATDAAGNALVVGASSNGADTDFLVVKLNAADGSIAWRQSLAGSAGGNDYGTSIAIDASGNAIVAGITTNATGTTDIAVAKYAGGGGALLWRKTFDGNGYGGAYVTSVDSSGNALVGAESLNSRGNVDIRVLKLAGPNGSLLWEKSFDGGADDFVSDLEVDSSGNAVVIGQSVNASDNYSFQVLKLAADSGNVLWHRSFDNGNTDEALSVALDMGGNVLVTGFTTLATVDFRTLKLAAGDGALLWSKTYDGGHDDYGQAIAVDSAGDAVVTGWSQGASGHNHFTTLKYAASDGAVLWQKTADSPDDEYAYAVALDALGNAIVVGSTSVGAAADWKVVAYAAADGQVLLDQGYSGGGDGEDEAYAVHPVKDGIFVAGRVLEKGLAPGLRVAKIPALAAPASLATPANGATLPGARVTFTWNDAHASLYQIWVGNSAGSHDIGYYPMAGTTGTSTTVSGLPTDGRTLHVRLWSAIHGTYYYTDATYRAVAAGASSASPATIASPPNGTSLAGSSVAFSWNDVGATLYQVWVGNTAGSYDVGYYPIAGTTGTSTTVNGLPTDGRKLHVRLWSLLGGVYRFNDFTYMAATVAAAPASITSPANGSELHGSTATFTWNSTGAALYQVWIGNSRGTYDIGYFPAAGTKGTSTVASGIPTDGRTLYVRLWSLIGGAYQYRDFTYRSGP
jgi:hypothetical protein